MLVLYMCSFEYNRKNLNNLQTKSCRSEKLLGVVADSELRFEVHTMKLCRNINRKVYALPRIGNFMY